MMRDGFSEGVTRENEELATRREHFRLKKKLRSGNELGLWEKQQDTSGGRS